MVIAIDGPAAAGKSSVARAVADHLGFTYLDTGAMYRAAALGAIEQDKPAVEFAAQIMITGERVTLAGRDVTAEIRERAVGETASRISTDPELRQAFVTKQQELVKNGNWVVEGRDIGTVVAPDAALKVFLTASAAERAQRRANQIGTDPKIVLREQLLRDQRDSEREHSPLRPAADAVTIDSTGRSFDEVVEQIVGLAQKARQ